MNLPEIKVLSIIPDNRKALYENIDNRVIEMISKGAIEEVRHAMEKYNISKTASHIHGIKEIQEYIKGNITYESMVATIQTNTRRYAKRQITWLRNKTNNNKIFNTNLMLSEYLTTYL